jgi:hypothetical protein
VRSQHLFACTFAQPNLHSDGTKILKPWPWTGIVSLLLYRFPNCFAGFEILTEMELKSTVLLDVTPYRAVNVHENFGGTYCLHLQGRILSQARSLQKAKRAAPYYCVNGLGWRLLGGDQHFIATCWLCDYVHSIIIGNRMGLY